MRAIAASLGFRTASAHQSFVFARALTAAVGLGLVVAFWGAAVSTAAPGARPGPAAKLVPFDSCGQLLGHVRARARALADANGISGYPGLSRFGDLPVAAPPAPTGRVPPPPPSAPPPPTATAPIAPLPPAPIDGGDPVREGIDFSGTNVQEAGVDEPDIVKTDGRRLFTVANGRVHAFSVEGGVPVRLGSIGLEDVTPGELLLVGDRLLVIGVGLAAPQPGIDPYALPSATVLIEVDVADPARMAILARLRLDGSYLTGRLTGTTARVVIRSTPVIPLAYPTGDPQTALLRARRANRRAIARTGTRNWLPHYRLERRGSARDEAGRAVRCRAVSHTRRFSGLGMITVLTVDLANGMRIADSDAVMTDGDLVYASPTALYVATPRWLDLTDAVEPSEIDGATTLIHRLDTSQPLATEYRGSGVVPGFLLNQFSLSEHEGRLRAASTDEPSFAGEVPGQSQSLVTVLEERAGALVRVGQVGGLGKGETVRAVRFIGARGYVVTFRQTDPLYSLDLSDPANPVVRGELKIPGFSSYLHPVGETLLLGVGQAADDEGRTRGTQVSLFDVSDPTDPRRVQQRELGPGSSEAEADHRAFLYWAPTRLLVLPVHVFPGEQDDPRAPSPVPFIGAIGLSIAPEAIAEVGRIVHPTDGQGQYPPTLRRSLVVGGTVLTVSDRGVMASSLETLSVQAFVPYP